MANSPRGAKLELSVEAASWHWSELRNIIDEIIAAGSSLQFKHIERENDGTRYNEQNAHAHIYSSHATVSNAFCCCLITVKDLKNT